MAGGTLHNLQIGSFVLRYASSSEDFDRVMALRRRSFAADRTCVPDRFDDGCDHVMVKDRDTEAVVCSFRLSLAKGKGIRSGYAAHHYDLTALETFDAPILEIGRFCVDQRRYHADIIRMAWAGLASYVDRCGVRLMMGCSTFPGLDPFPYRDAFALMRTRYAAPERWAPRRRATETFGLATGGPHRPVLHEAWRQMPPLLRSYLRMGAWTSDHVVIDRAMGTLHIFTGLDIGAVPAARKAALRGLLPADCD